jgi:mannose-1-phosphate guanylyltransferase/mannose-6-phosphate isomerase
VPLEHVLVVTIDEQVGAVRDALPELPLDNIVVEPFGRNTTACIALAVRTLQGRFPGEVNPTLLVLPADHHVRDQEAFRRHLRAACAHAEAADAVVTLGITPDRPATGFGWIERGEAPLPGVEHDEAVSAHAALRFVEKPNAETAQRYLDEGRWLWNAGIFVMPTSRIASELARLAPTIWHPIADATPGYPFAAVHLADAYDRVPSLAIDVAVMEKLADLRVIPADVGWNDIGSWSAVLEILPRDEHGNATMNGAGARTFVTHGRDVLVWNEGGDVAVLGVTGVAVVVRDGRVLVCAVERSQDVRHAVDGLLRDE